MDKNELDKLNRIFPENENQELYSPKSNLLKSFNDNENHFDDILFPFTGEDNYLNNKFYINVKNIKKIEEVKKKSSAKNKKTRNFNFPFVTGINFNFQKNKLLPVKEEITTHFQKNNNVSFGKSLNQILINSINDAILKEGKIINKSNDLQNSIIDDKINELMKTYNTKQKILRKKKLKYLSPEVAERETLINAKMPFCIKGYKKSEVDIFHSRNICDLDYQKYYEKEKINMKDILHYQNKYNRKNYLSNKIPFYLYSKSVIKPFNKKSIPRVNIKSIIKSNNSSSKCVSIKLNEEK